VVWNLLTNAIKFTTTSGRVDVRLEPADSLARITVSDTGKGIRSELLPFVFDRFRQGETSVSRRHGGLGLGLAIVRHIIELHGGIVRAESPGDGRGATFTVELPLIATSIGTVEAVAARRTFDSEPIVRPAALRGLRVLVVDDEADARELMRMILRSSGADVMAAGSADEAERGGSIPAFALTAYARAEDKARALAAGFQVHLAKPLEPAEFVAAIANLVKKEGVATTAEAA